MGNDTNCITITIDGDKFRGIKFNLHHGYELIYAESNTWYSKTISADKAYGIFEVEYLESVWENNATIDGRRVHEWYETNFTDSCLRV